ncbi:hypothetical protein [Paracoccus sp. (in: a-proteobacteria)]|uniref:hypothetical protein n=1 Tax=Paracoccus sp. TaxID=267 RepID=UPI002896E372|nr:hypothetical protein [Paracoccus sp. (in: a-proteobacteria)]
MGLDHCLAASWHALGDADEPCATSVPNSQASALPTALLRGITAVIAIQGIRSSFDLGLGTKLTAQLSIDFWDFNQSTIGFFAHLLAIIGLYMALGHYVTRWSHSRNRPSASRWGAAIKDVP